MDLVASGDGFAAFFGGHALVDEKLELGPLAGATLDVHVNFGSERLRHDLRDGETDAVPGVLVEGDEKLEELDFLLLRDAYSRVRHGELENRFSREIIGCGAFEVAPDGVFGLGLAFPVFFDPLFEISGAGVGLVVGVFEGLGVDSALEFGRVGDLVLEREDVQQRLFALPEVDITFPDGLNIVGVGGVCYSFDADFDMSLGSEFD